VALALAALLTAGAAAAGEAPTATTLGGIGLIETPTARFAPEGTLALGAATADPYHHVFLRFQPLPWLETTARVTRAEDEVFDGGRSNVDKSADIKFRLLTESKYVPALALGFQDFIGSGDFRAEFLVASKRFYDVDLSLGVGWGRLGRRARVRNPLANVSNDFARRDNDGGGRHGGLPAFGDFFTGPDIGFFGGIEYHTPIAGLSLKLEYDGNDYDAEPGGRRLAVASPVNVALAYRPLPWIDLGIGLERGNTLMVRGAITPDLGKLGPLFAKDEPLPPLPPRPPPAKPAPTAAAMPPLPAGADHGLIAESLVGGLERQGIVTESIALGGGRAVVHVVHDTLIATPEALLRAAAVIARAFPGPLSEVVIARDAEGREIDRFTIPRARIESLAALGATPARPAVKRRDPARALFAGIEGAGLAVDAVEIAGAEARLFVSPRRTRNVAEAALRAAMAAAQSLPANVERITVVVEEGGLETARISLGRSTLEGIAAKRISPEEAWYETRVAAARHGPSPAAKINPRRYPALSWSLTPELRQSVGAPDEPYHYQLWARLGGRLELARGLSLNGAVGQSIVDDFDNLDFTPTGKLPRVRSDIARYVDQGATGIVSLTADSYWNPATDWFARATAGLIEPMYGGVGAEVLYRPIDRRWAIGGDVFWVKQRGFDQRFDFRHYNVVTGHLNLYYELPFYGLEAAVHAGRFLARDLGASFELARRFANGIVVGAFATLTDVSYADFGEGSFDKGVFVTVPLDLVSPFRTRERRTLALRPLTADGGQRLANDAVLYDLTRGARLGPLAESWSSVFR